MCAPSLRCSSVSTSVGPVLTHWSRVTHICVSKLNIIGSDNGLVPTRRQCWNFLNWTPGNKLYWNSNRNSCIFIHKSPLDNVVWKMATILSQPQCVNPLTAGNTWMWTQHCGYWELGDKTPWELGAKTPSHQYLQWWLNILCIGLVSCRNITLIGRE